MIFGEAAQQIQKYGLVFKSPSGYPMPSPYLAILHTALDQMRAFLTEFGLSPASRSRVRVANPKQRDLFDDFLDGDEEEAIRRVARPIASHTKTLFGVCKSLR